jgi:acyl-CoA synthetase (AMP-forming)/AMP-acid ligase II
MAENVFAVTQTDLNDTPTVIELDADMFSHDRVQVTGKGSGAQEVLSCGRLVSGTQGRICDSQGNASPPDTVGEIHITSEFLFSGYYLQPEITEKKLRNGWYATGDLGFFHAGELYVTGRVDDMIVLNGRNYYAHDIEDLVNSVAGVIPGRSIAIGIDDQASDATVLVVLVEHRGLPDEGIQLARSIKGEILAHLGLAAYSVVALRSGSLLKTTSGKISRVKNKDFYLQGAFQSIPVET